MPLVEEVTVAWIVHPVAGIVPLDNVRESAVLLIEPPHVVVAVPEIVTPDGIGSVKSTSVTSDELELAIATDNVDVPPLVMEVGENDLVMLSDEVM